MRVLVQRVLSASVSINGTIVGETGRGVLLFVGFTHGDGITEVLNLTQKVVNLRIFSDGSNRLQFSLLDIDGEILAVPQFTLYGSTNRGRRPDFGATLEPELAEQLFDEFVAALANYSNLKIKQGVFGEDMKVKLVNDGPLTLLLEKSS